MGDEGNELADPVFSELEDEKRQMFGDLVWAQQPSYPHWPGMIMDPRYAPQKRVSDLAYKSLNKKALVKFFGPTPSYAVVAYEAKGKAKPPMKPFNDETIEEMAKAKIKKSLQNDMETSIEQAKEAQDMGKEARLAEMKAEGIVITRPGKKKKPAAKKKPVASRQKPKAKAAKSTKKTKAAAAAETEADSEKEEASQEPEDGSDTEELPSASPAASPAASAPSPAASPVKQQEQPKQTKQPAAAIRYMDEQEDDDSDDNAPDEEGKASDAEVSEAEVSPVSSDDDDEEEEFEPDSKRKGKKRGVKAKGKADADADADAAAAEEVDGKETGSKRARGRSGGPPKKRGPKKARTAEVSGGGRSDDETQGM
ncbi:unnamed protein product [Chrysoparadoxa australica]